MPRLKKEPLSLKQWLWIRNRIELQGLSLASIARDHGYHKSAVGLARDYRYPAIEKIIADTLGLTPQDLFPDRYTSDGKPLGRSYPRDRRKRRKEIPS
ncbi:MAG: helix-turn-helix domain-containing protein [Candidatus Omnitrophota bacterium]